MDLDEEELESTIKMMNEHPHLRGGITEKQANEWAESLKVKRPARIKTNHVIASSKSNIAGNIEEWDR